MTQIQRIARFGIGGAAPAIASRDLLPELAPPEERLERERTAIFRSDAISLCRDSAIEDVFVPAKRPEHQDLTARATVYVLNLTVMVFALPVGLALLIMNILCGENLRTTAHVMALTGLFSALSAANPGLFGFGL